MPLDEAGKRRALAHLRKDPVLARIIASVGPCRLRVDRRVPHFEALLEAIVYQQITGKAAATIHRRLITLLGSRHPTPGDVLRASDEAFREAGLSRQKIVYLRDLAVRVEDGLALHRMGRLPDEDVVRALTAVKGIGRWTAHMFLIFRLGRLDVLPLDDYGVKKAMARAYGKRLPMKEAWMVRKAEPWRPYRSVATWYLWRSLGS
jgi:3-methyladenine DNA glycosylase/8-oxoguanine DNA glycosylase